MSGFSDSLPIREVRALNCLGYDSIASDWNSNRQIISAQEARFLAELLGGVSPGARVLDLGCGTGKPIAQNLIAQGFSVTGVDQSARMLDFARTLDPEGDWIHSSIEDFLPIGKYSAAIAWDCLFHIPSQTHLDLFNRIREALEYGDRFMLTVGGGHASGFTGQVLGSLLFFDSSSPHRTVECLTASRFRVRHSEFLDYPDGSNNRGRFGIIAEAI